MPPKRSAQLLSQVQKTIKKSTRAVPRRVSIQNTQQTQIREQAQKKRHSKSQVDWFYPIHVGHS